MDGSFLRPKSDSDPQYVENFETRFETPGNAGDVSIYNGLAYIADGYSGLQVVNYRSYDITGEAPDLNVFAMIPPDRSWRQTAPWKRAKRLPFVLSPSTIYRSRMSTSLSTGSGIRRRQLSICPHHNGPALSKPAKLYLRVIARDTGGNEAYWPGPGAGDVFPVNVSEDMVSPEVITYYPRKTVPYFPVKLWSPYLMNAWTQAPSILRPFFCTGYLRTTPPNRWQYPPWFTTTPIRLPHPARKGPARYRLFADGNASDLAGNRLVTPAPFAIFMAPGNYMEISGSTRTITPSVNWTRKSSATGSPILTITIRRA